MLSVGADLRDDPSRWDEARAVAEMTMKRARENVERLITRLHADGYVFQPGAGFPIFQPPPADICDRLDHVESVIGPLPLALRAWLEHVGQVCLKGQHPRWEYDYTDALVVEASTDYILAEYSDYRDWKAEGGGTWDGAFALGIAPDYLHKANVSGGAPYSLQVPDSAVDSALLWERHETTFVNYLRIAFSWAGFPGVGQSPDARVDQAAYPATQHARAMEH
jgi:hypothetical protein